MNYYVRRRKTARWSGTSGPLLTVPLPLLAVESSEVRPGQRKIAPLLPQHTLAFSCEVHLNAFRPAVATVTKSIEKARLNRFLFPDKSRQRHGDGKICRIEHLGIICCRPRGSANQALWKFPSATHGNCPDIEPKQDGMPTMKRHGGVGTEISMTAAPTLQG